MINYLRLSSTVFHSLDEVADLSVDEVETAFLFNVKGRLGRGLLEQSAHILHELSIIEVDAHRSL